MQKPFPGLRLLQIHLSDAADAGARLSSVTAMRENPGRLSEPYQSFAVSEPASP